MALPPSPLTCDVLTRLYRPRTFDALALDHILDFNRNGDVDVERDRIIVGVDDSDKPVATLIWRPVGWIHEFHCTGSLGRRTVADSLMNGAIDDCVDSRFRVADAVFLVDKSNHSMLRYLHDVGAVQQDGLVFTIKFNQCQEKSTNAQDIRQDRK